MKAYILLALATSPLYGAPVPPSQTWVNPACAKGPCELKGMKLFIQKSLSKNLGQTKMTAEFSTSTPGALGNYAFVQYIRGCFYEVNAEGKRKIGTRTFFEKQFSNFRHSVWELDSESDTDPVYWSQPGHGFDPLRGKVLPRNYGYSFGNSLAGEKASFWAGRDRNLLGNRLYAGDSPTETYANFLPNGSWSGKVSSLEFKICLHEAQKVPLSVDSPSTMIPDPITCMSWTSNYGVNTVSKRVVEKTEIDPFCGKGLP